MRRQRLLDDLIADEGLRLKPYTDTVGKLTIGVGRNLSDVGISDREAMYLLDNDIEAVLADLHAFPWFAALDPVRQAAVANLRFNMGPTRFRGFRRMIVASNEQDYPRVVEELLDSLWATQVQPSRVERISADLRDGEDAS